MNLYLSADYHRCNWRMELGYNFWWHQAEAIEFETEIRSNFGIADLVGIASPPAESASTATIAQSATTGSTNVPASDADFVVIKTDDLSLNSARMPMRWSNTAFGSIGYDFDCDCGISNVALGFGYEFARKAAFNNLLVWGTINFQF